MTTKIFKSKLGTTVVVEMQFLPDVLSRSRVDRYTVLSNIPFPDEAQKAEKSKLDSQEVDFYEHAQRISLLDQDMTPKHNLWPGELKDIQEQISNLEKQSVQSMTLTKAALEGLIGDPF